MLITPGPLLLIPNNQSAFWLKPPAQQLGPSVATVWRMRTAEGDCTRGNAAVMAYASELYKLAKALSVVQSTGEAVALKKQAAALLSKIEEAAT